MTQKEFTILAVDDAATNLKVISNSLADEYEIKLANSASVALKILDKFTPSLILLDIMMPNIDGFELIKIIKENTQTKDIPVIFLTGKDAIEDEEKGLSLGAADYINKPIAPGILKLRIRNQLEIVKHRQMLEELIHIDHLTQIPNRRQFDEMFAKECKRSKRSNVPLSLYMIDIDHFKAYNDFYGHALGDEVLKKVAARMKEDCQRGADFLARWGGEEFAILAPELEPEQAIKFGNKLCRSIESLEIEHQKSNTSNHVTISIGSITLMPETSFDHCSNLLKITDDRLYEAKESGRNKLIHDII